jgi:hypothetical protein
MDIMQLELYKSLDSREWDGIQATYGSKVVCLLRFPRFLHSSATQVPNGTRGRSW